MFYNVVRALSNNIQNLWIHCRWKVWI